MDAAVMLIDASKGLEAQTMKPFEVCPQRGLPVITITNKWNHPSNTVRVLMDEIEERTGLLPAPLTWPVGIAGDLRGVLNRQKNDVLQFTRTAGGATAATEVRQDIAKASAAEGDAMETALEESELLDLEDQNHD